MREHCYYVYILANTFHRLYVGVTNSLMVRVKRNKEAIDANSFTARYGIDKLVSFEEFQYVNDAIAREKQLKRLSRIAKVTLIVQFNPTWQDLSEGWGKSMGPFDEAKMRGPVTFT